MKIPPDFYLQDNVVQVAKALLGKTLHTRIDGHYCVARITELEAYSGRNDKACHANNGTRTARTEVMYAQGGKAYVYLCYGVHHLFNVVTNVQDQADAVLIRAVEPLEGIETMLSRRKKEKVNKVLSSGPGTLSQALGIDYKRHYGADLLGDTIWLEDAPDLSAGQMVVSRRIGVDYAEEDALKPWRFYMRDSPWVSKVLPEDR